MLVYKYITWSVWSRDLQYKEDDLQKHDSGARTKDDAILPQQRCRSLDVDNKVDDEDEDGDDNYNEDVQKEARYKIGSKLGKKQLVW